LVRGWGLGIRGWGRALFAIVIAATPRPCRAAISREATAAIAAYQSALTALQRRARGVTVEDVYDKALALAPPLTSPEHDEDSIEHLSEVELATLERQLRGLRVSSDEVVFVLPDARFFLDLSRKYGGPADVGFFKEMLATYPVAPWVPTYVEQLSEVSACTAFQSGQLVRRYGGWVKYSHKYPHNYETPVADEMRRIEEETQSTCSCSKTLASYARELRNFNKHFPQNPARDAISGLINDVRLGRSKVRLSCDR
jgi:hypothetical protein